VKPYHPVTWFFLEGAKEVGVAVKVWLYILFGSDVESKATLRHHWQLSNAIIIGEVTTPPSFNPSIKQSLCSIGDVVIS
jgi:hypothetical protein